MFLLFCVISILWSYSNAQEGTDCVSDKDCFQHQICNFGYCSCVGGYIKNIHHCFKLRGYGEVCYFKEQCEDFRMICGPKEGDSIDVNKCLCDSFHSWNPELQECVQSENFQEMVRNLTEEINWVEGIAASGKKVFYGQVIAGVIAVTVGMFFGVFCIIYGCCFRRRKPIRLNTKENDEQATIHGVASSNSTTQGTYVVIPTDLSMAGP